MLNRLYYGDNLEIMKSLSEEHPQGFADLIYIDPPFNSKRNYNILYEDMVADESNGGRNTALKEAFKDTWSNVYLTDSLEEIRHSDRSLFNMLESLRSVVDRASISYLTMMGLRILYMHRLLRETGSFYLHCDPTMSHYLKIVCDVIFSKKNFLNEIVWSYQRWTGATNVFQRMHDTILFYAKSPCTDRVFHTQQESFSSKSKHKASRHSVVGKKGRLEQAYTEDSSRLKSMRDVWELSIINSQSKERMGYPTQKPENLLHRIIDASTNEGDVVADFFCGCGTAVVVAEKKNRRWLGVDISHLAISLIEAKRLQPLKAEYEVIGFPKDVASAERLAQKDVGGRFRFQDWIIEVCLTGHSQAKKSADGGFDGHVSVIVGREKERLKYSLIEVKSGGTSIADLRAFVEVIEHTPAADMGISFALRVMRQRACETLPTKRGWWRAMRCSKCRSCR